MIDDTEGFANLVSSALKEANQDQIEEITEEVQMDMSRCLHTRYDLGVTNGKHKGERSGVLTEEGPRAIINPFKEKTRQNGRRIKEPNEPMFTLTVTDRHGIVHRGRIRRLMPFSIIKLTSC